MSGSNSCCFRAVQSPVVMFVHPVVIGYVIELWHNAPITCCFGDMPSQYVSKVIRRHACSGLH